jgi:hypothetical protein
MPPRTGRLAAVTLPSAFALLGCSSSSGANGPVDITGTWLLCDSSAQLGQYDFPGGGYWVTPGGYVLRITLQQGVAAGSEIGGDGGPVYRPAGFDVDSGVTSVILSGPFDPTSRVWTAGFLWPHGEQYPTVVATYPALLTFSADGTRFTGILSNDVGVTASWFGGRDDGSFDCNTGSPAPGGATPRRGGRAP